MNEVELNLNTFDEFISDSQIPVLIDYYANWCGPCNAMKTILAGFAKENKDVVRVGLVDIESEMELASRYAVRSIPTQIVFKDGRLFAKSVGAKNEKQLMKLINEGEYV